MSTNFGVGSPLLKILNSNLTVAKTLYLPIPDKGGIELTWESMAFVDKRFDGTPIITYLNQNQKVKPRLTLKYKVYNDLLDNTEKPIGTNDGNTPTAQQLIELINSNIGLIAVSPGPSTNHFQCYLSNNVKLTPISNIVFKDFTLDFVGTVGYPSPVL